MKNKYYADGLGILLLIMLFGILPGGLIANANSSAYETLEVKLPYKHIYTTTDVNADSVFHYSIFPEDDAPLPAEAAADGVFSINGVSDSGSKDGNKDVFNLDGSLTFEFTKPGIYYYEIKADSEIDGNKKNSQYYTLNLETITIAFYINSPDKNKMNLRMITAQCGDDEKLDEIVLEAKYIEPETISSHTSSETPNSENSAVSQPSNVNSSNVNSISDDTANSTTASQSFLERALKTGDERNTLFYVILMILSAAIILATSVSFCKKAKDIK